MRWGLFPRLAVSLGLLLGAAMLTLGYVLLSDSAKRLEAERLNVASTLVRTLATGNIDALAAEDFELMERSVYSVLPDKNYAYAFLSRPDGKILTHSEISQIGQYTDTGHTELTSPHSHTTQFGGRSVRELVHPIIVGNKLLANAHIAYYLNQDNLFSTDMAVRILGLLGLFLLLLLTATSLIIRRYTHPLTHLTESITDMSLDAVHLKKLDTALLQRTDEIGALSREYSNMLERLGLAYEELRNEEQLLREKVEERTRELRLSYQELETFSYSVSHDLRSPLRAMAGYGQMLLEDYGESLDEDGRHALQRICANAIRMDQLILDLLALSRVSRQEFKHSRVDLSDMAHEIFNELQKQHPERKVEIEIDDTPLVDGDKGLLRIAMQNLIDNAWKYSGKTEKAVFHFGAVASEPGSFFIRDNGSGFDMRYVDKIFGVFQRLHAQDVFEGTGIGLATVERVIHRHGGIIRGESEIGKGATFTFSLPLAKG
ncbi:Sensory box histidine kinase [hydrothermal vent metagenome]|uniref:histidine kinase n=1 Tax=hydrothermal vent metagenome TaxID=652676 RepID=A0A3B0YNQ0_9ZZZZ